MDANTRDALVGQCAFYFSDANLRRDRFLRKHVGNEGTGSVAVDILATFNRVKELTTDRAELMHALRAVPGLRIAADETSISRIRPLPDTDDSKQRTVYVERLPDGVTIESLHAIFAGCGSVAYVSLPRLPSRDPKGYAFVEFVDAADAVRAVTDLDGTTPAGGRAALRVMHMRAWTASKEVYKKALAEGKEAAEAESAAAASAAAATSACAEEAASAAAAAAIELERRTVVTVRGLPKRAPVKALRREMNEVRHR
jgi:hypothetical protein